MKGIQMAIFDSNSIPPFATGGELPEKGSEKPEAEFDETYQKILEEIRQTIDFKWGSIFLKEFESCKLKIVARVGDGIDFINRISFSMGMGLSAWVAQKKRVVHLPDIHRGTRHEHHPVRSFVSIPLVRGDQVIGVLNLAHLFPNAFGDEELHTLESLCEQLAQKIFN
jgi:GAF domain-containing protein